MSKKRLYSDKEISAVLKRAAELQRVQGPTDASGLSLAELEQVAAEVGIDPGFVKTAVAELEEGRPDEAFHLLGAPTSIDLERIVEGEMTEAKWEEAVAEIRRVFGAAGEAGQVGRTREWIHRDQTGERVHVTVSPTGKQTRVRVFYRMVDWAWALHGGLLSVTIAPIVLQFVLLNLGPLVETGIALFILAAFHMVARLSFGAIARKQDRKARKLLTRLDELIAVPEAALPEQEAQRAAPEGGRIDPSLLSDAAAPEHDTPVRPPEREGEGGGRVP